MQELLKLSCANFNWPVDIFDSPGLECDADGPDVIEEYLQEIYEKCKGVDLFLYCLDMTSARFTRDDR